MVGSFAHALVGMVLLMCYNSPRELSGDPSALPRDMAASPGATTRVSSSQFHHFVKKDFFPIQFFVGSPINVNATWFDPDVLTDYHGDTANVSLHRISPKSRRGPYLTREYAQFAFTHALDFLHDHASRFCTKGPDSNERRRLSPGALNLIQRDVDKRDKPRAQQAAPAPTRPRCVF